MKRERIDILNEMEKAYDIEFTNYQLDILLGNTGGYSRRQTGKTFGLACKAILECLVDDEKNTRIYVILPSTNQIRNFINYLRVLMNKLKIDYKIESNKAVKVNNSIICFKTDSRNELRGLVFDYLLIDDANVLVNVNQYFIQALQDFNPGSTIIEVGTE